jgi:hypothetical protein
MFMGGRGYILIRAVVGICFGCVLFIIMKDMFLLLGRIWGYVYLQKYNSFVIFVYLNYVCEIIHVYLVIVISFKCVVILMFGQLRHMRVLFRV